MSQSPLQLLVDKAHENHATLIERGAATALFSVDPPYASDSPTRPFIILLELRRGTPVAREHTPQALPAFCPERHINSDGTFCLFWAVLDPLKVIDWGSAGEWWRKVLMFLAWQRIAAIRRKWPGRTSARAHGPEGAWHQAMAEKAASAMGPRFVQELREERLTADRRVRGRDVRVRLLLDGRRLATVVEGPREGSGRVMTLRSSCKCGNGQKPLRSCKNHAQDLADLTLAIDGWRRAEVEFFKQVAALGLKCCGTMDDCPLAAMTEPEARAA